MLKAMMEIHDLADEWSKQIGLSLQGSAFAPILCRVVMLADFQADGRLP